MAKMEHRCRYRTNLTKANKLLKANEKYEENLRIELARATQVWDELSAVINVSSMTGFDEIEEVKRITDENRQISTLREVISTLERRLEAYEVMTLNPRSVPLEKFREYLDVIGGPQGKIKSTYTKEFHG